MREPADEQVARPERSSGSFLVRLWSEEEPGPTHYRAFVRDLRTGREEHVPADQLLNRLVEQIEQERGDPTRETESA